MSEKLPNYRMPREALHQDRDDGKAGVGSIVLVAGGLASLGALVASVPASITIDRIPKNPASARSGDKPSHDPQADQRRTRLARGTIVVDCSDRHTTFQIPKSQGTATIAFETGFKAGTGELIVNPSLPAAQAWDEKNFPPGDDLRLPIPTARETYPHDIVSSLDPNRGTWAVRFSDSVARVRTQRGKNPKEVKVLEVEILDRPDRCDDGGSTALGSGQGSEISAANIPVSQQVGHTVVYTAQPSKVAGSINDFDLVA